MSPNRPPVDDQSNDGAPARRLPRRRFVALGAGAGAALFAGCTAASPPDGDAAGGSPADAASGPSTNHGTFRLLVSDRPADIADFDSLEVTLEEARIFGGERSEGGESAGGKEDFEAMDGTPTATATESTATATEPSQTETETSSPTPTQSSMPTASDAPTEESEGGGAEAADDESDADGGQGAFTLDIGGKSVDLTQLVGEKATAVFEGELEEGRYRKVELYAADVVGMVDGESVDVTVPSGKLQLVKPFEVAAGETLSFVFDINVVRKGRDGGYNLQPVISESGVAGDEVPVEEVGNASARGPDVGDGDGDDADGEDEDGDDLDEASAGGSAGDSGTGNATGGGDGSGAPDATPDG